MTNMYQEIILDHYRYPRNHGKIDNPTVKVHDVNPLCGDEITMYLKIADSKIAEIKFLGGGCAISQAAASMLTEHVLGKSLDDVKKMDKKAVLNLLGIELSYARLKCALLSLKILKTAVYSYEGEKKDEWEL